jgi:hypothetical protein
MDPRDPRDAFISASQNPDANTSPSAVLDPTLSYIAPTEGPPCSATQHQPVTHCDWQPRLNSYRAPMIQSLILPEAANPQLYCWKPSFKPFEGLPTVSASSCVSMGARTPQRAGHSGATPLQPSSNLSSTHWQLYATCNLDARLQLAVQPLLLPTASDPLGGQVGGGVYGDHGVDP